MQLIIKNLNKWELVAQEDLELLAFQSEDLILLVEIVEDVAEIFQWIRRMKKRIDFLNPYPPMEILLILNTDK